jgi:hypothetical protein
LTAAVASLNPEAVVFESHSLTRQIIDTTDSIVIDHQTAVTRSSAKGYFPLPSFFSFFFLVVVGFHGGEKKNKKNTQ